MVSPMAIGVGMLFTVTKAAALGLMQDGLDSELTAST